MFVMPSIDPIAFHVGPLAVRWYGLMYGIGFLGAYLLLQFRIRSPLYTSTWKNYEVEDLIVYGAIGVLLGGRIGYIIFYDFFNFLKEPLRLFRVWEGGMSFHGGLLGVLLAMIFFARKFNKKFFEVTDFISPFVPIGLGTGRLGNFINSELWGKVTDLPWGIASTSGALPRHPTQLYECFLEGAILFLILWVYTRKERPRMAPSGLFLLGYGVFRFGVEFVRLPDPHIGYLAWGWLTLGQVLTAPMIMIGLLLIALAYGTVPYLTSTRSNERCFKVQSNRHKNP
ncbi:MAG: prolipoprotein diacylglyceryl transferase [Gammaproteobacteria bacterium]|nr:prolipoprotein diacylglyceryl transferase [Gammaproteobacteria bacterium]